MNEMILYQDGTEFNQYQYFHYNDSLQVIITYPASMCNILIYLSQINSKLMICISYWVFSFPIIV